jgi:hypothetical protein
MKILEQLRGAGMVTSPDGEEMRARYDLKITQDESAGGPTTPGTVNYKHITGRVWSEYDPYFVPSHIHKTMLLQMEDGRKFKFFHREMDGTIGLSKWLG